eukprot:GHVQ01039770.1.p1 GENE.GHVQ01039770.1~~GHVQ01039770.1.p1  ORF type:complete len:409 (+),score=44.56 GHVQ01039770.1:247-1473(+)
MSVPTVQLKTPLPHHRGRWNHLPFLSNYLMGYALLVGLFACLAEASSLQALQLTTWHSPQTSRSRDNPWMRTPSPAVPHVSVVVQERGLQVTTVPTGDSTTVATEPSSVVSPSLRRVALLWGFPVVLTVVVTHQFDRRSKFFTARYAAYSAVAYGTARMQRYIDPNFNLPWPGHDSRWSSLLYKIFSITWPGHDSIWPLFFYNILGIILVDRIFMWLSPPSDVDQYSFVRVMSQKERASDSAEQLRIWMQFFYKRNSGAYAQRLFPDQGEARRDTVTDAVCHTLLDRIHGYSSRSLVPISDEPLRATLTNGDSRYSLFIVSDCRCVMSKVFVSLVPTAEGKPQMILAKAIRAGYGSPMAATEEEVDSQFEDIAKTFDIHSSQKWDFRDAYKDFWNANDSDVINDSDAM